MKIRIGKLRTIIRETLDQMKLGIAEPNPPGRYFSGKDDDDIELPKGRSLEKPSDARFGPGDEYKAWNDKVVNYGNWDEDSDDDLDSWLRDSGGYVSDTDPDADPAHADTHKS